MPNSGHIALVTGHLAASYFTFGNMAAAYFGVMPVTEREKTTLPVAERLKLWMEFFDISKLHMPTSAVVAALSLSVAAYFTSESPIRNLLAAGAAASFGIPAWTLIFMLPLNSELTARLKATSVKPMEPREEQRVLDLLDKWRAMHRVRMVLGTIALSASLVGLLATDRVI